MAWVYLIIAGFGEIGFVVFMKLSNGFSRLPYSLLTGLSAFLSFYFLAKSLLELPVGTAYAIWTGIGACGSVLLGMIFFGESKDWKRLMFIVMIIGSVIGLKVIS